MEEPMQQGSGAPEGGVPIPGPPKEEEPPVPELPPNNTIYVNNVCEKIKIPALIIELKAIFNQFGPIVEIQVNIIFYIFVGYKFFVRQKRT